MSLETLGRRTTNIRGLVLEEPIKKIEGSFDPNKDITEEDWTSMERSLAIFRRSSAPTKLKGIFLNFLELGGCMNLLFPDRNTGMDNGSWTSFKDRLKNLAVGSSPFAPDEGSLFYIIHSFASARIIFPSKSEIRRMSETYKEEAFDLLHTVHSDDDLAAYINLAYDMAILFPEQDSRERLKLDESTLAKINNISPDVEREHSGGWFSYAFHLGKARLLYPQYKPAVGEKAWKKMKEALDAFRETGELSSGWLTFAKMSLNMKLIAAEEVSVTEDGVNIIMPAVKTPFVQPTPGLPTLRRF